ncbi:MAG: hypothetical protein KKD77_20300 [Gammaproteobacteria bacterium]|nr:hypothetical protein [Gammaproteobacteria bacterium]
MSLDVTKPIDSVAVSAIPSYIREDRAAINALAGGNDVGVTEVELAALTTSITVGVEVGAYGYETVVISAAGAINLATMIGGTQGQVKVFIFQDNNISIVDGAAADGKFYLNQLPALSSFATQTNDILALVNVGGDGASVYGYWKELYRQVALK